MQQAAIVHDMNLHPGQKRGTFTHAKADADADGLKKERERKVVGWGKQGDQK